MSKKNIRILVINPNTTVSMTNKIGEAARSVAAPDVEIVARNPFEGPVSIQGPEDGIAALPGMLEEVAKGRDEGFDAIILACFDDTGLAEARRLSGVPTIGIGEASFHAAMLLGAKFSVVTTLSVSVPIIEHNIREYGLDSMCLGVRASEVPVLDLENPDSDAQAKVSNEIAQSMSVEKPGAVVLGCAGMADLAAKFSIIHKIPVVDGVVSAVGFATGLVRSRI